MSFLTADLERRIELNIARIVIQYVESLSNITNLPLKVEGKVRITISCGIWQIIPPQP